MAINIDRYLARKKEMQTEKDPWNIHYQRLAELFLVRKQNFLSVITPGEFLREDVFDNTGERAAHIAASTFLSMLWPDSARSFELQPVRRLKGEKGVEEFFQRIVNPEMYAAMDNPKAGLTTAYMEHLHDQMVFGTSGVGTFEGMKKDGPLVTYEGWGIKNMLVTENAQGFVDTIFFTRVWTVRQLVEKYSKRSDRLSPRVLSLHKDGRTEEKVEVLHVIEPKEPIAGKKGIAAMPYRSLHIDIPGKTVMREGGYEEMPVAVARMFKTIGEVYGRSPGMIALPDASSLNVLKESVLVASEKQLDPPLGVLDDGRLGGGVVDTSAGGLSVFNTSGRVDTRNPIFPLFTVGEMQSSEKLQERLEQSIMGAFFLDRLLDLNNQTQMTAYETSIRNRLRGESLGSMFARQIMETITPTIERTFNILYRKGRFGINPNNPQRRKGNEWDALLGKPELKIPQVILDAAEAGLDIYDIEYISPAKRMMQSEKLQGTLMVIEQIREAGQVIPEFADNFDIDDLAEGLVKFGGAPATSLRTEAEKDSIRDSRAQQQEAMAKLEAMRSFSETARNAGQATASVAGAGGGK